VHSGTVVNSPVCDLLQLDIYIYIYIYIYTENYKINYEKYKLFGCYNYMYKGCYKSFQNSRKAKDILINKHEYGPPNNITSLIQQGN